MPRSSYQQLRLVDGGILQRQLDQRVGEDLDDASAFSLATVLPRRCCGPEPAGPLGVQIVVRGAGGLSRGLGLWLGLPRPLLASCPRQRKHSAPRLQGHSAPSFPLLGGSMFLSLFSSRYSAPGSRNFWYPRAAALLSSWGVLCLRSPHCLSWSLGRVTGWFSSCWFSPSCVAPPAGFIVAGNLDLLIFAVRRRCSVVLLHGDAFIIRRDHKAAVGKIERWPQMPGRKGIPPCSGPRPPPRSCRSNFFSSHDFYLLFCILWLFCQIYYTPPLLSVQYNSWTILLHFFSKMTKKRRWPAPLCRPTALSSMYPG